MRFFDYSAPISRLIILPVVLIAGVALPLPAAPLTNQQVVPHRAKPSFVSTQMLNPQAYKAGTPERALAEFLAAWRSKNFSRVAQFTQITQITWKHSDPAPVQALQKQFAPASLISARIVGVGQDQQSPQPTENIVNLKTSLRYHSYNGLHTQTLSITVVRELRPLIQNKAGTWGVDPEFTVELDK